MLEKIKALFGKSSLDEDDEPSFSDESFDDDSDDDLGDGDEIEEDTRKKKILMGVGALLSAVFLFLVVIPRLTGPDSLDIPDPTSIDLPENNSELPTLNYVIAAAERHMNPPEPDPTATTLLETPETTLPLESPPTSIAESPTTSEGTLF